MSRADGQWFTTRCGITDPGAVLAEVDEPRGNAVKLLIGVLILGAVLGYSVRRVKRRDPAGYAPPMRFERVLVVGAGQMGAGIAQVVAASGRQVLLHDPFPGAVERGLAGDANESREARGQGRPPDGRRARRASPRASSCSRPT